MMSRLCVFTGSATGTDPIYRRAADSLGRAMASRGIGLVFGGGRVGLMGVIADAVMSAGGEAIGVIPEFLEQREVAHASLTQLHVVTSMHVRKALMADLSDGFIAMPGGLGTLDELFEILTWSQLDLHSKPIGVLNTNGYFTGLLAFIDQMVDQGFVKAEYRDRIIVGDSPDTLLDRLTLR